MKKIVYIILVLFCSTLVLSLPHNVYATITINRDPASKVTLTHGYKGMFCQIEDIAIRTPGPLTVKKGASVAGINIIGDKALYKDIMQNAPCISGTPTKEIIVGDTLIDYVKGYQGDETFFIIDNKMYRTGGAFYDYYVDENYHLEATLGGKMKRTYDKNAIEGIEYTGSEHFFEAEYLSSSSSDSARIANTKYIKHYSAIGIDDGTIITFLGKTYRRTEISKELSNVILLDYGNPTSTVTPPTNPDLIGADWKTFTSIDPAYFFSFKYPPIFMQTTNQIPTTSAKSVSVNFSDDSNNSGVYSLYIEGVGKNLSLTRNTEFLKELENVNPYAQRVYSEVLPVQTNGKTTTTYYSVQNTDPKVIPAPGTPLGDIYGATIYDGDMFYRIEYWFVNTTNKVQEKTTFLKILSTFKFIDQTATPSVIQTPTPTCMIRPACMDANPRCMIVVPVNGWCP